jgi:serine/threonine-protein kinase
MEVEAGRRTLEALGLQLEVTGRATHPSIPAFAIIEQAAPAGAVVPSGTAIRVIISQGPQLVEVPFLAGKTLGEAQSEAQANELLVETHQAWSDRLPGTVVDQDPPPGSLVQSRSLVRLTVSSGTQVPVGARLGDTILLVSYELPSLIYRPGDSLSLTLAWQAIRPPGHAYSVGVYLSRADGSLITQQSGTPAQGSRATDTWAPGSPVIDNHQLDVPSDTPAGEYWLRVAMLNGGMRLPVTDAGEGKSVDGDLVLLAIQVK